MRFIVLQHHHAEGLGNIEYWLKTQSYDWHVHHYGATIVNDYYEFDGLIVLGGPMHVDNANPNLMQEIKLISHFIANKKPTLGICLGAQLIAFSLGASVSDMVESEMGWSPIITVDNMHLLVAQWHQQECSLPAGAKLLASSQLCAVQMFSYDSNVLALQFHPEWNNHEIAQLQHAFANECPLTPCEQHIEDKIQSWWYGQLAAWIHYATKGKNS